MGPMSDSQGPVQNASSTRGTTQKTPPTPVCEKTMRMCIVTKPSRNPGRKQEKTRGITELFHMYRLYRHDSRCINALSTNMFAF